MKVLTERQMAALEDALPPKMERVRDALQEAMLLAEEHFDDEAQAFAWLLHEVWDTYKPTTVRPRRRPLPQSLRRLVMERDEYGCVDCGATDELQIDHVIPHSKGGPDTLDNLQVLCGPCNRRKGAA